MEKIMKLAPYIRFKGECKEAMDFYRDAFGAELKLQLISESPAAAQMPPEMHNQVMHATLSNADGVFLMASDMSFDNFVKGNDVTLMADCKSETEIQNLFEKLSAGGEIYSALKKEFWGAIFGQFKDKYGFIWMLNYDSNG
jgi:PhnB protein